MKIIKIHKAINFKARFEITKLIKNFLKNFIKLIKKILNDKERITPLDSVKIKMIEEEKNIQI